MKIKALTVTQRKAIQKVTAPIQTKSIHDGIPLQDIQKALKSVGFVLIQEDQTEWEGMLMGTDENITIPLANIENGHEINGITTYLPIPNMLIFSWYKINTDRYDINFYIS